MENTQDMQLKRVKAASMGFVQAMLNRGASEDQAYNLAQHYISQNGVICKRASARAACVQAIDKLVAQMRAQKS